MGRQCETIINHFSHPHPLHLITNPHPSLTCSACKQTLNNTEPIYTCKTTSCTTFFLHLKCSQLPIRITHPCHHNHPLSLVPNYGGVFACNACGKNGDGFLYNCKDCDINIHVMCATLPLYVSHPSHSHQLNLVFLPPYGNNNGFCCDVCGVNCGSYCWLYRCVSCGFDAHLSCATSSSKVPQVVPQVVNGAGRSVVNGPENLFLNQLNYQRSYNQHLQAIMSGIGSSNNINNQILQGMMGGIGSSNNQILQGMMDGIGNSNNINNQILQGMMGGGGNLQAMLGGGGGGGSNPLLEAFMGGGGGGGDLVQSILNGSGGGVGGVDLSSVLGGGGDLGGLMGAGLGGGFGF